MTTQIVQVSIIAIYLIVLIFVGKTAGPQIKSHTDYHLAGRQMSWVIIAAGLAGTNYSGAVTTSVASLGYQFGIGGLWFEAATVIGFIICAFIYVRRARLSGAFTISELFEVRYDFPTRLIAGLFIMLSGIAAAAAQFKGIGLIVSTLFNVPESYGIAAAWIIIVIYMTFAGFWATNLTNLPQLLFCFLSFPVIFLWAVKTYGGWATLTSNIVVPAGMENTYFTPWSAPLALVMTWALMWMWINEWGSQWYFQRAVAARNVHHAKLGFLVAGLILLIGVLIPILGIGMYARLVNPNLENPELALSSMLLNAPALLGGLAAAGIFAAAMSTVDGCSMGAITVLVRDFYHRTIKPNASASELTKISRIVTVSVLIIILILATMLTSALKGLGYIFIFNTGLFAALLSALYWKKASKEGALLSILAGGGFAVYWTLSGGSKFFHGAWWAFAISAVVMVVVSLIVSKTGPWWGNNKIIKNHLLAEEIMFFMQNRNVTFADLIDRTGAHAAELRLVISGLVMEGELREIDYLTYSLKENSSVQDEFKKDSSASRDVMMIIFVIIAVATLFVMWNITH